MKLKRYRYLFLWIGISVVSAGVLGVALGKGLPYIWNLPEREVNAIQNSLPLEAQMSAKEEAELVDKYRGTLVSGIGTVATIVGGFVLIANVYLAVKKFKQDADKNEIDKNLAESRLISERFSKSIEQLGSEIIHIRLGGIYSLEKIAKDSPDDHWTVMEVLTAFIREESPRHLPEYDQDDEYPPEHYFEPHDAAKLPIIIQSAATVIARREVYEESGKSNDKGTLNLNATNLNGVELSKATLSNADLIAVSLRSANLAGANLYKADLEFADLSEANLEEANLEFADLSSANLRYATLLKANLVAAKMEDANLYRSQLPYAYLSAANLTGANLINSHLRGARLEETNLAGANLNGSNLVAANLRNANLNGANLRNANLNGAQNLTEEQLETALLCCTRLPEGINIDPDRDCEKLKSMKSRPFSN